jgi:hypothetical protein
MNTVVNYKSKDILRDIAGTPASSLARRNGTKTPGLNNAIAWGSYLGQALAVRRAAQERRCKLTWPVTPDNTASEKGSDRRPTKPATPPYKAAFVLGRNRGVKQFNEQPTRHAVSLLPLRQSALQTELPTPRQWRWRRPNSDCSIRPRSFQCRFDEARPFEQGSVCSISLPSGVVAIPGRKHPRIPVCGGALPNAATGTPA